MKKRILLILILLLFIVVIMINKFYIPKKEYYKRYADTVIGLFRSEKYDNSFIKKRDKDAIETFLSKLTHKNEIVSLDDFITKNKDYYTSEGNTPGVYTKNNKCYIKYSDINFNSEVSDGYEPTKKVVCNNYYTILAYSDFYPSYEYTTLEPKYDYIFKEEKENINGYSYIYESTYDTSLLEVKLIINNKSITKIDIIM